MSKRLAVLAAVVLALSWVFIALLASIELMRIQRTALRSDMHAGEEVPSFVREQNKLALIRPDKGNTAFNWAGYMASEGTYTAVSGTWIVPTARDLPENPTYGADATWVGIGGAIAGDLLQAGTEALPDSHGRPVYQAWLEMLPRSSQTVPLEISPGDLITVSIIKSFGDHWEIAFDNSTTGRSYRTSVYYPSSLSSVEWIEELPIAVNGSVSLDDFGSVHFTNGYAIRDGKSTLLKDIEASPLAMANAHGEAVATPTIIDSNGSGFAIFRSKVPAGPISLDGSFKEIADSVDPCSLLELLAGMGDSACVR